MSFANFRKNREKRNKFVHLLAAFIILLHAFEKYQSGHSYLFFAIAGAVFLTLAILHPIIEKKAPWIDGVFFVIESMLSFIVAYEYFHAGKKGLPYCYVAAGIAQLFVAIFKSKKGIKQHREKHA